MKNFHLPTDRAKLMGVMHMEVDKVADMMMDMEVDMVSGKVAARISTKR